MVLDRDAGAARAFRHRAGGARERRGNHERRLVDHAAGRGFGAKRVDLGMDRQ